MTTDEINDRIRLLSDEARAIYDEKSRLEQELRRRSDARRGEVLEEVLPHRRFGVDLDVRVGLRIRVPDSDWVEDDPDALDLAYKANQTFNSDVPERVLFRGRVYWARDIDGRVVVTPDNVRDQAAWQTLLDAAGRDNYLGFLHEVESYEQVIAMLRSLVDPPKEG